MSVSCGHASSWRCSRQWPTSQSRISAKEDLLRRLILAAEAQGWLRHPHRGVSTDVDASAD